MISTTFPLAREDIFLLCRGWASVFIVSPPRIHISLGISVWGYTYHGDTHITVTSGPMLSGEDMPSRKKYGIAFINHKLLSPELAAIVTWKRVKVDKNLFVSDASRLMAWLCLCDIFYGNLFRFHAFYWTLASDFAAGKASQNWAFEWSKSF